MDKGWLAVRPVLRDECLVVNIHPIQAIVAVCSSGVSISVCHHIYVSIRLHRSITLISQKMMATTIATTTTTRMLIWIWSGYSDNLEPAATRPFPSFSPSILAQPVQPSPTGATCPRRKHSTQSIVCLGVVLDGKMVSFM